MFMLMTRTTTGNTPGKNIRKRPKLAANVRILVVEDDPSIRETLGMVLDSFQYRSDLVESGEQVLDYLARIWPDVMLLDLTLPGTTGEEVYQNILNRFGRVPATVVFSASQQGASRASHLPGAWFLGKPYTLDQLEEIIEQVISTQAGAA
jgi:DNA-binding response OmpR family regulator